MENRLVNLETQLAFQEDLIQKLDVALGSQQRQILDLQDQVRQVVSHIKTMESLIPDAPEPPPPHY